MTWNNQDTCYFKLDLYEKNNSLIAFDYDATLSEKFTANILPDVEKTLLSLGKTHNICIFTNQMGISKGKTSHEQVQKIMNDFEKKILNAAFCIDIEINLHIFYSTEDDIYRKPMTGMFELMKSLLKPKKIEYYCGDGAGGGGHLRHRRWWWWWWRRRRW